MRRIRILRLATLAIAACASLASCVRSPSGPGDVPGSDAVGAGGTGPATFRDTTPFDTPREASNPRALITFGPAMNGIWGPFVRFEWNGEDDDGLVVGFEYTVLTISDWRADLGITDPTVTPPGGFAELLAWADSLTTHPITGLPAWVPTTEESASFELPFTPTTPDTVDRHVFGVKAIDDDGLEDEALLPGPNSRVFRVVQAGGPRIAASSKLAGVFTSGSPAEPREIFASPLRFSWRGAPGPSGTAVVGFSVALNDTSSWPTFSSETTEWPPPGEPAWIPALGTHTLFVRAVDEAGFLSVLPITLEVFPGPWECDAERRILVVLDTDAGSLIADSVLPVSYPAIEEQLARDDFAGVDIDVHRTSGSTRPPAAQLSCASSVFWIHTAQIDGGDGSVLRDYHLAGGNPLPSYVASGGNLLLCGIQPSGALRLFQDLDTGTPVLQQYPLRFRESIKNPDLLPHWAALILGVAELRETIGNTFPASMELLRLGVCRSAVSSPRPYPDLEFDPLTWPQGPLQGGFGYYDRAFVPFQGSPGLPDAQVIYTANDSGVPVAVRRLSRVGPGTFGSTVYLGFHPYFLDQGEVEQLVRAVLADFGER